MKYEYYTTVCISTQHLEESDTVILDYHADNPGMVMVRDTGWFIKLYEDLESNKYLWWDEDSYPEYLQSPQLEYIIKTVHAAGFRMIEFDTDAMVYPEFKTFDW